MDIAKIRKRLKKLKADEPRAKVDSRTPEPLEDRDMQEADRISESGMDQREVSIEGHPEETEASAKMDADIQGSKQDIQEKIKVLEEEAKAGATTERIESQQEELVEILTFRLTKEEFAFRISHLEEILRHQHITKLPRVPKYILGITSLRGKVIPVIDLKLKLSLSEETSEGEPKKKILIVKGPKGPIGATVDKVIGVVRIAKSEILPPPSHLSDKELKFIDGVAVVDKHFVSIINMEETVSLLSK